ncbi:MAG: hypothetical protein PHO02_02060 [Candidatus Nanoarchaeia archaeon]|nr:hypothetical protein [Candidatus Nanoarchaeia archaeon]
MEDTKLVGILNTEVYRQKALNAKDDEKALYESKAVYAELEERMRKGTLKDVIEAIIKNSDEPVAVEARDYLRLHNGSNTICEVRAYNTDNSRKKKEDTEILPLDEKAAAYIDMRKTADETEYDCLDLTVKLYDDVGNGTA